MSKFYGSVQISKDDYYKLKKAEFELSLLIGAGADNWDGIDEVDYDELDKFKQELFKELDNSSSLIYK